MKREPKPRKPLAVGDRVRVYGFFVGGGYSAQAGTIVEKSGAGFRVEIKPGVSISAHPKQCRRLRKREKQQERKSVWLFDGSEMVYLDYEKAMRDAKDYKWAPLRELVYLLPGEVLTDRRRLESAWNDATKVSQGYALANDSHIFKAICKALGVP